MVEVNIGEKEYGQMIDRRKRPRSWFHDIRLWCVRDEDGRCKDPRCNRKIGRPDFPIDGAKAISPEDVEAPI